MPVLFIKSQVVFVECRFFDINVAAFPRSDLARENYKPSINPFPHRVVAGRQGEELVPVLQVNIGV
jgi:hypothetical protein